MNQEKKFSIKKLNDKIQLNNIKYKNYNNSISNYKLSSYFIKKFYLNNHKEIKLTEIISSNLQKLESYPSNQIIYPIYISENKILN